MMGQLLLSVRRAAAFFPGLGFTLNSIKLSFGQLQKYAELFTAGKVVCRKVEAGGEEIRYGYCLSPLDGFAQDSCVNGIDTPQGGTHVDKLVELLVDSLVLKTKATRALVKSRLMVFCFFRATRPSFNAQIKVQLTSKLAKPLVDALREDVELVMKRKDETGVVADVAARKSALGDLAVNKALGGGERSSPLRADALQPP